MLAISRSFWKKTLIHFIALFSFLIIAVIYCKPALNGKVLHQTDVIGYKAMAQQSVEFKDKYGHYPLWTESMFSGMPTYNIALDATSKISTGYFYYLFTLGLPKPINYFFLACLCFYILTQVLRLNPLVSILSSLAYAYSTYNPILATVGHETKLLAIGYIPAVVAGLLLIFQKKYLSGAAVLAIFVSMQTGTQHLQIIYYTGIILGFITIAFFIQSWKQKQIGSALIGIVIAVSAGAVGFLTFAVAMLPTREYAKETMRGGKSELSGDNANKSKGGLDKDYAFRWSFNISEPLTMFVPGLYGGGTAGRQITGDSRFAEKLSEIGMPEDVALNYANSYSYWGGMSAPNETTAGPAYIGAVICFLFILGLVYVKSWHAGWILAVTIFGILLAWGKNFGAFNYFLFDHLPFYNKFRAPSVAMVIPAFTFPLLSALGLQALISGRYSKEIAWKKFKQTLYITGGLFVLIVIFYFMADFRGYSDPMLKENFSSGIVQQLAKGKQPGPEMQQQAAGLSNSIMKGLQEDRQSLLASDLIRSFLLILMTAVFIGAYLKTKIKQVVLLAGILILSSYDLLAEGRKYFSEDNFVDPVDIESSFAPTPADQKISADPDKNFRVFDQTAGDPFSDSHASYLHNSIGGYHPAKLALYDDLIQHQLRKGNMTVYNMLNTKYFIRRNPTNGEDDAYLNPNAFGSCWLVKSIHFVNNADEEMQALDSVDLKDTAVVQKNFSSIIKYHPVEDSAASIRLVENLNDKISYAFSSRTDQFAVFSEVYYDKGWDAFLDGKKTDYCKVDYVLRGMPIPAGVHKIEFRFEPHSYTMGNTISVWSSILVYLLLLTAITAEWVKKDTRASAD